jgi:ethylmalonyl-CoA/methylmalonyl-CoA decarboxylase
MNVTLQEARDRLAGWARERRGAMRLELEGPIAHLRIDHAQARSAMSLSMMTELADAVLYLQSWDGMLVILSSTDPRAFCSGGHLGEITEAVSTPEDAADMSRAMGTVLAALRDLPAVSVAAVDGLALGGGAELVTATDLRVAGPEARIQFVHARLGIAPGWGGTARLVQLVGRQAALKLLLLACHRGAAGIGPGEAFQMGLVDHRCDGPAVPGALAWLAELCALSVPAVRAVKRQLAQAEPTDQGYEGAEPFSEVWGGPAHREALQGLARHRRG